MKHSTEEMELFTLVKHMNNSHLLNPVLETYETDRTSLGLISDRVILIFQWVVYTAVWQAVIVFGIGTNIINIICFMKQGFKDPVNISLFGKLFFFFLRFVAVVGQDSLETTFSVVVYFILDLLIDFL